MRRWSRARATCGGVPLARGLWGHGFQVRVQHRDRGHGRVGEFFQARKTCRVAGDNALADVYRRRPSKFMSIDGWRSGPSNGPR
jgi:hypothetical protein